MGDSAMLVSSHEVTEGEFQEFISMLGGAVSPQLRASVSEGESTVWISLLYISRYPGLYEDYLFNWEKCLGGAPKTVLEMRLDHTQGARELYLRVAFEFGRLWSVVLVDVDDVDVSYELVCEKYIEV